MKAIRVRKRGRSELYTVHSLLDPERTYCGRKPAELEIVEELELEKLPPLEGCRGCMRVVADWADHVEREPTRITAPSRPGRLRTTGNLAHGLGRRTSRRLP